MKKNTTGVLIGVLCLPLLALGAKAMFTPMGMVEQLAVEPNGLLGLNTIRGDIGGYMIGIAIMMIVGLWSRNTAFFLATAIMMGAILMGRFTGLALDGFDAAVVPPIMVELVIACAMVVAHKVHTAN